MTNTDHGAVAWRPLKPASKLQVVANFCSAGGCPTIYRTDRGTLLVQGYTVAGTDDVDLPEGETLVEIPIELLAEAAKSVG